jgi:hypothetical protein
MRHLRFNIASILGVIFFLGIGFAALREANDYWDSGLFTLTLGAWLVSILLAIYRCETGRAFWIGFALFGWGYLALSSVPSIESRLLTTKGLAYLDSKVPGRPTAVFQLTFPGTGSGGASIPVQNVALRVGGTTVATPNQGTVRLWNAATGRFLTGWSGTTENFIRIGHSLLALVAAWIGGQLSRRLHRGSRPPELSAAEDPATRSGDRRVTSSKPEE